MLFEVFAQRECQVERITDRVSDGAGGWLEQRVEVGSLVGSLQPAAITDVERNVGDVERAEVRWSFFCDPGSDVRRSDRLVFGSGREFAVVHVTRWQTADDPPPGLHGELVGALDHDVVFLREVQTGG